MKFSKTTLTLFLVFGTILLAAAQAFDPFNLCATSTQCNQSTFGQYTGIVYSGAPLYKASNGDNPLTIMPGSSGTMEVFTIDNPHREPKMGERIGFLVAIKDHDTNSVWMYSDRVLYEVDVRDLLNHCDNGDVLIFMTADRSYRLPRHEVLVMDGC